MYNESYYKGKKDKVLKKIQISKDTFLQRQVDETGRFLGEQKELAEDINEINAEEQESKKTAEKPKLEKPKPIKNAKRK